MKKTLFFIIVIYFISCLNSVIVANSSTKHYAEEYGWKFDNWKAEELPWSIYEKTYIGISPLSVSDTIFYNEAYKDLAKDGHCFGMCLLQQLILHEGGHFGFCGPISQYSGKPPDNKGPYLEKLREAIRILHGYQLNMDALKYYLQLVGKGDSINGNVAFNTVKENIDRGFGVIICITKTVNPKDGGHTMVPYKVEEGGDTKKIYVYDPSYPYSTSQNFYDNKQNYILINNIPGTWRYQDPEKVWGVEEPMPHIVAIPISIIRRISKSAASYVQNELGQLLFFSGEGADIKQVTDGEGKRLYIPNTAVIDTDPSTGMRNMTPIYFFGQATDGKIPTAYFIFGNYGGSLNIEVENGSKGYKIIHMGKRGYTSVEAIGGKKGREIITLNYSGTIEPSIILRNNTDVTKYNIEFHQIITPEQLTRSFTLSNLKVKETATIGVTQNQNVLRIIAPEKLSIKYDLILKNITREKVSTLQQEGLIVHPGTSQLIRPQNWDTLKKEELRLKLEGIKRPKLKEIKK